MRITLLAAACLAALAACGMPTPRGPDTARAAAPALAMPPLRTFASGAVTPPRRSNAEMAGDILDLVFQLESGRAVPRLTRFDGPVTVRMIGPVPPTASADLARLVGRINREAGIPITVTGRPDASVTIEFLSRRAMDGAVPQAACFVAPNVSSWADYRRARSSIRTDWTALNARTSAAIFIPADTAPQEIRDCLHEELAQALGPLNDLYRLHDSVFNDDNMHGVLTGFDMLVLRAIHAPELANGMGAAEVAARLPAVLARINPGGGAGGIAAGSVTPRAFVKAVETAIGPSAAPATRRNAAITAVRIAEDAGWRDTRTGFAKLIYGRLSIGSAPDAALTALFEAGQTYSAQGLSLQAAHVEMQLAAFALSQGDADGALALTARALGPAAEAENAGLMASLMMVRAEALDLQGRAAEAEALRLDSLGWARYGFGSEAEIRLRMGDIMGLNPARRSGRT